MSASFTVARPGITGMVTDKKKRVLLTGAAGNIGTYCARDFTELYDLRLMVHSLEHAQQAQLDQYGDVVAGDVTDIQAVHEACRDVHTVVHLAGEASPSGVWDDLLHTNIIGTYNTYVAAMAAGCKRVIYASSIHAVSGYQSDVQVKTTDPVNPGDLYGVSKCFGEALARYMAEQEGISSIVLRIGAFQSHEAARDDSGLHMLDAWVSERDLAQLIRRCIDADNVQFAIFNAISDNRFKRLDISDAQQLIGYRPADDATQVNERLRDLALDEKVAAHNVTDAKHESGLREDLARL
jgi:UDP-glucose 4-epimerase